MTERSSVHLRTPTPADFPLLAALRRNVTLQHALLAYPTADPLSDDDVRAWISRRSADIGGCFLVVVSENDAPVGFVQIADVHRRARVGKVGIALEPSARGKGMGLSALRLLEEHAKSALGLQKLILDVRADNSAAIEVYRTAGYRTVGTLKAHYDDGETLHDVVVMERLIP